MKYSMKPWLFLLTGLFPLFLFAQLPNIGLLGDFNPGSGGSSPGNMTKLGSNIIFRASDGMNGNELWKTDGTLAGTSMIKDIRPGSNSSNPNNFVLMGGHVYFTANDGTNGGALWRTDGTNGGTTLVKDINPSTSSSSFISQLTAIGSKLYFRGDDGTNGTEPWVSDGTTAGTFMLKNINPTAGQGGVLFGTSEFVEFNGFVYFTGNDGANGGQNDELWRTDGTTVGTVLFKDNYSFGSGGPGNYVNAGSYLFFTSDNQGNTGVEPWKTDGTLAGTVMIKDVFNPGFNQGSILGDVPTIYMNGYVYFVAVDVYVPGNFNLNPPQNGYVNAELWRTDGTAANTTKVKEINPATIGLDAAVNSSPNNFYVYNNKLYFTATDGTNGFEPWVSDGTSGGTFMLKNINSAGNSNAFEFTAFNGFVYFSADDNSTNGSELWRTDGTSANTVLVKNINPGGSDSSPGSFEVLDANHMLFGANTALAGSELYILGGYKVTVTSSANGKVSPPGDISTGNTIEVGMKSGTSQTFTFTPNATFSLQSVLVDGGSVGAPGTYTFSNISANHTLSATFGAGAPTTFTINASAGTGGSISPSGAVSVASGGSQAFTITPNSGFCIQSVTVNGVNQGAISTYTFSNVTSNQTIAAAFSAATTYYRDMDGDGFGNPSNTTTSCSGTPSGYVANNTDCNDNNLLEQPGQVWYKDVDNDGYAETGTATITQCLRPVGYIAAAELISTIGDCNDNNAAIKPGATEVCDGIDNNCNSMIDEGVLTTYYRDMDMDGFGNPSVTQMACSQPTGYVANNTDCNDNSALEKPGQVWYKDTDGDNYAQTGAATITQCLRPSGYKAASELTSTTGDCNDSNAAINPGATEVCDGIDNNCNSMTDEGVLTTYYRDMDMDGSGNPAVTQMACSQPTGYVTNNTDCNDNNALEKPGQVWYKDTDGDGYAETSAATITQCLRPTGYKAASELTSTTGDCNDNNAAIKPGVAEVCDGIDNNCNSMIDEGVQTTYYRDMDMDGFGNPSVTQMACSQPTGYVTNNTDCNDNSALEKPGQVWYKDVDGDGYAETGAATLNQCLRPTGYKAASELTSTTGDCNDNNAAIKPGVAEVCDGIDNNCNSMIDEGVLLTFYRDMDMDGFGNPSVTQMACSAPGGYVANNTDCNDNDALEKPGQIWYKDTDNDGYSNGTSLTQCLRPMGYKVAAELTAISGDCDDSNPVLNPSTVWYKDTDNDNYSNGTTLTQCLQPMGYKLATALTATSGDCDDNDNTIYPGAPELCDGKDNNCNTETDENEAISGAWSANGVGSAGGSTSSGCSGGGGAGSTPVFNIGATGTSSSSVDNQQLIYRTLCGDGSITVHVSSIDPTGGWAGIIMREDLTTGSRKASLKKQSTSGVFRDIRTVAGGASSLTPVPFSNLHTWLRIVRTGNNFSLYTSTNGMTWGTPSNVTIAMPACIYIGMFAESINGATTTNAVFDQVMVTGSISSLVAAPVQGIQMAITPEAVKVYPNPGSGRFQVELHDFSGLPVSIKVTNSFGAVVLNKKVDEALETEFFDLSEFASGIYWLQIQAEGYLPQVQKIILSR